MNQRRCSVLLGVLLLSLLAIMAVVAGPPTTPTIDGYIAADNVDWDVDELIVDDSMTDSAWGTGNELDNLYATWDENNLYVGISYTVDNNAMIVYTHTGRGDGETDFNSGRGWTGAYPRNITFTVSSDINLMLARWAHNAPQVYTVIDNASTDVTGSTNAGYTNNMVEIGVPWSVIGRPYSDTICLVAVLAGGDNYGAADSMPDNASTNGDGGPDAIDNTYCFDYAPYQDELVINELDSDTPGTDAAEFIELYDGGHGNTLLDGLVIVFFNGNGDLSYYAIDLDGFQTDAAGYFLAGNAAVPGVDVTFAGNLLQNGADAVALYWGDSTDFESTPVTTTGLVDAIVYDTADADDPGLLVLLNAGQPQVDESSRNASATDANQRCPNGAGGQRNTNTYIQRLPTPKATNDCVDVAIAKTGPTLAMPGSEMIYTVSYNNAGAANADNVVISDTLPVGVYYVSDDSGLPCPACLPNATGTITWTAGIVGPGASSAFSLTVEVGDGVPFGSVLTNTVGIHTSSAEVTESNNEDEWTTNISALDLRVAKEGPAVNVIGEPIVYTITLTNIGVATATNVIVTDTLPISTTYDSDSSGIPPTNPAPGVYAWSFGDVPSATVLTFNLTVTQDAGITRTILFTNVVEATTTAAGDDPANNTDLWETTAYPMVTIHDIQYVADPVASDVSPYSGQQVWTEGVVVAGTDEIGSSNAQFVIEDPDGGPWSGLLVYNYGAFPDVQEGDYVQALGTVQEYSGMTELSIRYAPHDLRVVSTGNPLPTPEVIDTGDYATTATAEQWESVLIRFEEAVVTELIPQYGEWTFDDGTGNATADDWGEIDGDMTYVPALGDYYCFIQGIGWFSYGLYMLEPRYDADISVCLANLTTSTKVSAPAGQQVRAGDLVTYTITLINTGTRDVTATAIDSLPGYYTVYDEGDFVESPAGTLTWTGAVPGGGQVELQFVARVIDGLAGLPLGVTTLANSVLVDDGINESFYVPDPLPPWVIKYGVYLPLVSRNQ